MWGEEHSEDLGTDGKIIIERISRKKGCEYVDKIHVAQDRDQWRALMNTVKKFGVP
jgi:hypothetical protein